VLRGREYVSGRNLELRHRPQALADAAVLCLCDRACHLFEACGEEEEDRGEIGDEEDTLGDPSSY
jgi:hypothetical protein